jgi:DNA-binding GntR family transcriptional regulator
LKLHELSSTISLSTKVIIEIMNSLLNIIYARSEENNGQLPADDKKHIVLRYLLQRILNGEYLPGEHLNEYQITKQTGVSNIPIRQAIERLIHLNLVERIPNKGVFLKMITQKELKDSYDLRIQIETYAIRQLAPRIKDQQLIQLNQLLAELKEPFSAVQEFKAVHEHNHTAAIPNSQKISVEENINSGVITDLQYHLLLIHFTDNKDLELVGEILLPKLFSAGRFRRYYALHPEFLQFIDGALLEKTMAQFPMPVIHQQINQALIDRNADQAAGLMKQHLEFAYEYHKARLELFEKSPLNHIILNGNNPTRSYNSRESMNKKVPIPS